MNRTDGTADGMCRTDPDTGRRRVLFRSWRRGTLEVGLLLGSFAEHFLAVLDGAQLDRFGARAARPVLA
jgi:succinate dehydrogenase flavin-adding protein (antitoxin of CptAB toxin-antitoxin module)